MSLSGPPYISVQKNHVNSLLRKQTNKRILILPITILAFELKCQMTTKFVGHRKHSQLNLILILLFNSICNIVNLVPLSIAAVNFTSESDFHIIR